MSKEELIYNAKLAEHSERYSDMISHMKQLIDLTEGDLNNEERTLLSVAYKQAVGERRNAWRIIGSYEEKQKSRGSEHLELISEYKQKIEKELHGLCMELVRLIDSKLLKGGAVDEIEVFYLKMKGDYFRYMAEAGEAEEIQKSFEAYSQASDAAKALPVNNPVRLGLALNFSVFYYELKKEPSKACELAKTTFDEALPTLEELDERAYKEATSILGLIKDNLTLWTSEEN
jgi:14-3-3 protein epsilon